MAWYLVKHRDNFIPLHTQQLSCVISTLAVWIYFSNKAALCVYSASIYWDICWTPPGGFNTCLMSSACN